MDKLEPIINNAWNFLLFFGKMMTEGASDFVDAVKASVEVLTIPAISFGASVAVLFLVFISAIEWLFRRDPYERDFTFNIRYDGERILRATNETFKSLGLYKKKYAFVSVPDEPGNGKKIRVALTSKNQNFGKDKFEISEAVASLMGISNETTQPLKFRVRKLPNWTMGALWNHPDLGVRMGVRVAIILLVVQLAIQEPLSWGLRKISQILFGL